MHGCVVNFVMHYYYNCLDSDINVCDALLFVPQAVSFLIFLKKCVTCISYGKPMEVTKM
jgi:hypothetical protein